MTSISEIKKRGRGRPATGFDPAVTARLPEAVIVAIDQWAAQEACTRAAAIRRLVEIGLAAAPKPPIKDPVKRAARRAQAEQAAAAAIDKAMAGKPAAAKAAAQRRLAKPPSPKSR